MDFHASLKALEADASFKTWHAAHPDHYFVHGFFLPDPRVKPEWQFGFYNKKDDQIVTFAIDEGGVVTMQPPSAVFKNTKAIKPLNPTDVKQTMLLALEVAHKHQQTNYKGHEPAQIMVLVQNGDLGPVWNITFITNAFSVCNMKLDTRTNAVVHASCETLLAWGEALPGTGPK